MPLRHAIEDTAPDADDRNPDHRLGLAAWKTLDHVEIDHAGYEIIGKDRLLPRDPP